MDTVGRIALIEPFYGASHKQWADGLKEHSQHHIQLYTLPDRHWKWRMHGGAISCAEAVIQSNQHIDLFLVSDFTDLALFKSLTQNRYPDATYALYFHENQLTYPWSPDDQDVKLERDNHYAFINYSSALIADAIYFNSYFHRTDFLNALPTFLQQFPKPNNISSLSKIEHKSFVLYLGVDDAPTVDVKRYRNRILWNHRWEYDKDPETFFKPLFALDKYGHDFELVVLGESHQKHPTIFEEAYQRLQHKIVHWGYASDKAAYWRLLHSCDLLPMTSRQEFFGLSLIEAMQAGVIPLCPNRLTYPEHLKEHMPALLYRDNFYGILEYYLSQEKRPNRITCQEIANQYLWKKQVTNYDTTFLRLIDQKNALTKTG